MASAVTWRKYERTLVNFFREERVPMEIMYGDAVIMLDGFNVSLTKLAERLEHEYNND